ncbi:prepilin peptidase [Candidatus Peregrinibacteria bacterium]|nr:MAG: prepilin peptidase [Candidatus Peregrinibacteria bacterium]
MKIEILIAIIVGLAFGSFASALIHRLHSREKGLLTGRSKCPKCQTALGPLQLIPLISYCIQKAKCAFCKEPISYRYPLLEVSMAAFFGLTTYLTEIASLPWLLYYLFLTFIFVTISFYDLWFKEIPDELSLPTIVVTGVVGHLSGAMNLSHLWIGFAIPVLFFGGMFLGSRGRWIGGGDVRIGGIMGFVLGYPQILVRLF